MKKIGILTINDYKNYGNRLQNYAVQEVLKSFGFDVVTIINTTRTKSKGKQNIVYRLKNLKKYSLGEIRIRIVRYAYCKLNKRKITNAKQNRMIRFREFTNKYINETDYSISIENIPDNLDSEFDYFVTGSDQVWNPTFRHFSEIDFLTFARRDKRVAFSPSFGISSIPAEYKDNFKKWLSEMQYLSVREEMGEKIIFELTGRKSCILIDPTLMLSKDDWIKIIQKARNKPTGRYLLTYFLGEVSKDYKESIKKFAKENSLTVVHLASIYNLKLFDADPGEFIDYINSSDVFFTDSYHGAIFSILLKKPFVIFQRISNYREMSSRIDTLLSKLRFESRKWENIKDSADIFNIDFSHVKDILKFERAKVLKYLEKALDSKHGG